MISPFRVGFAVYPKTLQAPRPDEMASIILGHSEVCAKTRRSNCPGFEHRRAFGGSEAATIQICRLYQPQDSVFENKIFFCKGVSEKLAKVFGVLVGLL